MTPKNYWYTATLIISCLSLPLKMLLYIQKMTRSTFTGHTPINLLTRLYSYIARGEKNNGWALGEVLEGEMEAIGGTRLEVR